MYTGFTLDLRRRLATHNAGHGAKYTKQRLPVRLLWTAELPDARLARRAEVLVKRLPYQKKRQLAAGRLTLAEACPRLWTEPAGTVTLKRRKKSRSKGKNKKRTKSKKI